MRRALRSGKLKGQRINNQWFVKEEALNDQVEDRSKPLLSPEFVSEVLALRRKVNEFNERNGGPPFDVLEMIRRHRDED